MKKHTFMSKMEKEISFKNVLNLIFLITTVVGVATSIFMNFADRSLWLDEALLAYSFSKRSFWTLWDGALEGNQSAPLGWLYFEKVLTKIFGNTAFVIRMGSVIGFILTLVLIYYLLKNVFHCSYSLAGTAFYANIAFILKYSNEFKPYISDGFFVLLVIYVWHLYVSGKINFKFLALFWAVLLWFSNPTCFFEGGLLIAEGIFILIEKNIKKLKELFIVGVTIITSFFVYYLFWIKGAIANGKLQNYWKGAKFLLVPTSSEDVSQMKELILEIFCHIDNCKMIFYLLLALVLIAVIIKKNRILIGCYIGIFITCLASNIGMFPVADRLWCFIYALLVIICFYGLNVMIELNTELFACTTSAIVFLFVLQNTNNKFYSGLLALVMFVISEMVSDKMNKTYIVGLMAFVLVFSNDGISCYLEKENVYRNGEEINNEIAYLAGNIKEDEAVYVYSGAVAGFQYTNGYDNYSIGEYANNVIYGKGYFYENSDCDEEIQKIISHDKIYIAASHIFEERIYELLNAVHENGYFQLVLYDYKTPLWFYCNDLADSKIHVSYEIAEYLENGNTVNMILRIHNEGEAYLNHNWEMVGLVNCETRTWIDLGKNIAPGQSTDVPVSYERGSNPVFRLENEYGLICKDSEYSPEKGRE